MIRWAAGVGTAAATLLTASLIVASAPASAIEQKPLPAFSVAQGDGSAVLGKDLTRASQYVLIYVAPNCRPCDRLVQLLKNWKSPEQVARVVFIVADTGANAASYVGSLLPQGTAAPLVYGDDKGDAYRALKLTGMPVIIGVRSGRIMWSVSGVLNDATTVQSVVRTWVTY